MATDYDVVVVGGRCAGAPLAMLLARAGFKVCVFERHTSQFEMRSTHTIQLAGVRLLDQWGALPRLKRLGAPLLTRIHMIIHGVSISGLPWTATDQLSSTCVKRGALDTLLGELAIEANAEVLYQHDVRAFEFDGGRWTISASTPSGSQTAVSSRFLVAADGMMSSVASRLDLQFSMYRPSLTFTLYKYVPNTVGSECYILVDEWGAQACVPTTDGDMIYVIQRPTALFDRFKTGPQSFLREAADRIAKFAAIPPQATLCDGFRRALNQPSFIRAMLETGACLIGDAWSHKDSVTAQGITDAFLDADLLAKLMIANPQMDARFERALKLKWAQRTALYAEEVERANRLAGFLPATATQIEELQTIARNPELSSKFLGLDAKTYSEKDLARDLAGLS
ncbi:NAD(P)/FAD-dependent oxidoreductase [Bradyrhizobium arachidis]|uniref:FAD-dependent oxidoreductase n=1 Tax=Bradyrhizobium arachidis TaxID=858423 RepID=UPI002161A45F|nr:FAD-dependent monooxygenase [Bradyrhizobium arachidis]UVO30154.1 FAD-dependent monooxygenase [Bradyrhizobium arachidis]